MASRKRQKPALSTLPTVVGETSHHSSPDGNGKSPPAGSELWLLAARALLIVAAGIGGYLAWHSLSGGSLPGCGPESPCDRVLQSRWAYWMGIPVSVPAVLIYLGLLIETFSLRGKGPPERALRAWLMILGFSVLTIGAALWFVGLQVFLLKSFCKFCLAAHAGASIAAILLLRHVPLESAGNTVAKRRETTAISSRLGFSVAALGVVGWVVLAFGQLLGERPASPVRTALQAGVNATNSQPANATPPMIAQTVGDSSATKPDAPPANAGTVQTTTVHDAPGGSSNAAPSASPPNSTAQSPVGAAETSQPHAREMLLHGGQFALKLDELPIIGSPGASNVVVSLFDYSCHYCRDLHHHLVEAQKRFADRLGIVSLPMPLSAHCNHLMKSTPSAHQNACEYAFLGLAVWRAKPGAFRQFDDWLFGPPSPPSVAAVAQYAEDLVGRENLDRALSDEWVRKQVQTDVAIYEANSQQLGGDGRMPQLIIGATVNAGPIDRIEELYRLLVEHLGLKANETGTSK